MDYPQRLQDCLHRVICDPAFTPAELDHWFTPDYLQHVDDKVLDYAAFRRHILALREDLAECQITFLALIAQGERVHSTHLVRARRRNGQTLVCKVSGLFTFRAGRLCHTDELTCLLQGDARDRDIGSRH